MKKLVNGVVQDMTEQEIAQRNVDNTTWNNGAFERAMANLRQDRNKKLAETDWWGASDHTMTAEQTQYRQDLRDITNGLTTVEQVEAVEFPEKP
jgi:inhibitor of KinA sporulation pathway (predicted exonuclease)